MSDSEEQFSESFPELPVEMKWEVWRDNSWNYMGECRNCHYGKDLRPERLVILLEEYDTKKKLSSGRTAELIQLLREECDRLAGEKK